MFFRGQITITDKVPSLYYRIYEMIFTLVIIVSLFRYHKGYLLIFDSVTIVLHKNILLRSTSQFEFAFYSLVTTLFINIFLRNRVLIMTSLLLYALIHLNVSPTLQSYTTNLPFFLIALFMLVPSSEVTMRRDQFIDSTLLKFAWFLTSLAYVSSALTKLITVPGPWLSGEVLYKHLLIFSSHYHNNYAQSLLDLIGKQGMGVISVLVVMLELFFLCSLKSYKTLQCALVLGLIFHLVIYLIFGINFFYFYSAGYLAAIILLLQKTNDPTG